MNAANIKLRVVIALALLLPVLVRAADVTDSGQQFDIKLPLGIPADLWSYFVPKDNPLTAAKVKLGRDLFFDKRLSVDGTISCSSCHNPETAFADGKKVSEGVGGRKGVRNSPSLLNAMFNSGQFWDGRAESLEAQARLPLINVDEMGNTSYDQVVARIRAIPEYESKFKEAFGGSVTIDRIASAIASFERTLISANSPFDRFMAGDRKAISDSAFRGLSVFRGKARCGVCHNFNPAFPFLTDQNYRNTGVAANSAAFEPLLRRAVKIGRDADMKERLSAISSEAGAPELGRFIITGNALDIGAFRTPSLRNVELTAPYFHDGSAQTLSDVIEFYIKGGNDNPSRDWELQAVDLTGGERDDLIEFLKSLTGDGAQEPVGANSAKAQARASR